MLDRKASDMLGKGALIGTAAFVAICAAWDFVEKFALTQGAMGRAVAAGAATLVLELVCAGVCWWVWRNVK